MDLRERHHVTISGRAEGPTIMFAHGFGCDQRMWRFVAPAFEHDHRVVLFDHAGAGRADPAAFDPVRHGDLEGYAQDVVDICRELQLDDVVFVGHSVSAIIGALASIRAPDHFSCLVMIGPSPRYIDDDGYVGGHSRQDIEELLETMDRNYLGWTSQMAAAVAGDPESQTAQELENSFCRADPDIAKHFARTTFLADNRDDLALVGIPCLVLQVDDDAIAPVPVGQYVTTELPQAQMTMIDTVGHCPHLSAPDATIAAIRGFL